MERENISSGTPWEDVVDYSRAVKIGNTVEVSGTVPVQGGKVQDDTAYEQTIDCLEIIQESLEKTGATMENVVRMRIFVTDISQWEEFGKAHGEYFGSIKLATSMVEVSTLIDPEMLVEIETTAILGTSDQ